MLENKIKELSKKIIWAVTAVVLSINCGHSEIVPTKVPSINGYIATGEDCCKKCESKGYNSCKKREERYNQQTGNYEQECSCYNRSTSNPREPSGPHIPGYQP